MDRFTADAADALRGYEEIAHRTSQARTLWPPAPPKPIHSTWAPKMTAAEKAEFGQYVIENNLPF